jgi:hypothetical protein
MTAPTERTLNTGLRYACTFELNASGTPKASSTTAYEGLQFQGSTAFELNVPDARKLTGLGEDGITQVVYLPPTDGVDGKLNTEGADPSLSVLLDGTKIATVGEISLVGMGTDKQGFEPQVGLMLYQLATGLITGKQYWHTYFLPSAKVIRKPGSMTTEKASTSYQIAPNRVNAHLWGADFSTAVEGYLSAQVVEAWSNYPLRLASFLADGTAVDFIFPVNTPAVATAGIVIFVDGTLTTAGITKTITKVTFTVAPTLGQRIDILREVAG